MYFNGLYLENKKKPKHNKRLPSMEERGYKFINGEIISPKDIEEDGKALRAFIDNGMKE